MMELQNRLCGTLAWIADQTSYHLQQLTVSQKGFQSKKNNKLFQIFNWIEPKQFHLKPNRTEDIRFIGTKRLVLVLI